MSGNLLAECIRIDWDNTYNSSDPTDLYYNDSYNSSDPTDLYYNDSYSTCIYTVRSYHQDKIDFEKIKEILRKQVIQEMKDQWNDLKKLFKPVSKIRSSIQLRGVSFNGRGWA